MVLLLSILFTSILVVAVKIVTHEGMALHSLFKAAENIKSKWMDPLILCPWCMPSLWSSVGYMFTYLYMCGTWNIYALLFYPLTVGASSIISGITWTFILYLIDLANYVKMKSEIFKLTHYEQEPKTIIK